MLEKFLHEIGLNEKEIAVYLYLLQVENNSILEIATKTTLKRPTVYLVIESLLKKGLVSEVQLNKKTHYQAEPPERLETYVERQKVLLDEHSRRLKDVIPQLKSVQRKEGEKPVVKYLEGRDGVISSLEDFFKKNVTNDDSYSIYSRDLIKDIFTDEERKRFKSDRKSNNIQSKAVYNSLEGDLPSEPDAKRIRLDQEKYPILCDIGIYGDEVRIATLKKFVSAIVIKNKDLAETLKSLVNYILDSKN
jgi:sugar-specific transcriptional regulator TrmB